MSISVRALLVSSALVLTACSSSGGDTGSTGGLTGALGSVSGGDATSGTFQYGDLDRMRSLGLLKGTDGSFDPRWGTVVGSGAATLAPLAGILTEKLALPVFGADTAITLGDPPDSVLRLDGSFDASAITSKLKSYGAKAHDFGGTDGLSFGADNAIDMQSKLVTELHLVNQLDQVVVSGDRFVASPNSKALAAGLGGGSSLLDTDHYRDLADCLGDVIAAVIAPDDDPKNTSIVAYGVRAPDSPTSAHDEVVCALPADGKLQAVQASFTDHLGPKGVDPRTRAPMSTYTTGTDVDTTNGLVRAVLHMKAAGPAGYVLQSWETRSYLIWDGSCTGPDVRTC